MKWEGISWGPTLHHMSSIWQVGIKSINISQYQVEPIRPIRLLGLHQVGFIGHHMELRGHQGKRIVGIKWKWGPSVQ